MCLLMFSNFIRMCCGPITRSNMNIDIYRYSLLHFLNQISDDPIAAHSIAIYSSNSEEGDFWLSLCMQSTPWVGFNGTA
jgi:hypothetical protein